MSQPRDAARGRVTPVVASKIIADILKCDPSIENVAITDESGVLIGIAAAESPGASKLPADQIAEKLAGLGTIIIGIAQQAEEVMDRFEFSVFAFKGGKALVIKLPSYRIHVLLRLRRSVMAEHVFNKIVDTFAANEDLLR